VCIETACGESRRKLQGLVHSRRASDNGMLSDDTVRDEVGCLELMYVDIGNSRSRTRGHHVERPGINHHDHAAAAADGRPDGMKGNDFSSMLPWKSRAPSSRRDGECHDMSSRSRARRLEAPNLRDMRLVGTDTLRTQRFQNAASVSAKNAPNHGNTMHGRAARAGRAASVMTMLRRLELRPVPGDAARYDVQTTSSTQARFGGYQRTCRASDIAQWPAS